ncbi:chloroplast vesiculation [Hibiscus trionum]|uniref:Chloroplast vesiculation n=1 Tax=Hibiscus trionum TaxID=183268 RepID=A0A9W7IET1_HIBTR|nr:chloroplast vesiculation [Hibiscus trionum]
MAISTRCCVNVSPPIPNPSSDNSSFNPKGPQVAWTREDKWRKQCTLGLACMLIGLQVGDMSNDGAIAKEIPSIAVESNSRVARWSDKRMCPPWQANSLETIVPENLPRPSAHRRWEAIGFSNDAPAIKVTVARKTIAGCFSM